MHSDHAGGVVQGKGEEGCLHDTGDVRWSWVSGRSYEVGKPRGAGAEKMEWAAPQAHAGTGLFWENGKSSGGKLAGG